MINYVKQNCIEPIVLQKIQLNIQSRTLTLDLIRNIMFITWKIWQIKKIMYNKPVENVEINDIIHRYTMYYVEKK